MGGLTLPCLTTVTLLTGLLCSVIISVSACSCEIRNNHEKFCDADFAVKAKVRQVTLASDVFSYRVFDIKIQKVFKSYSGLTIGDNLNLTSSANAERCGVLLTEDIEYFLSGSGSPPTSLGLCSWISEWSKMTKEETRGVRGQYQCGLPKISSEVAED
ncbi:hypothetical protein ScPMuIL_016220 [Solemya velum]